MSPKYYKGYRVGSLERGILKILLNIKSGELPNKFDESYSDIFKTVRQKNEYSSVTKRLIEKGILKYKSIDGQVDIVITDKGRAIANKLFLLDFHNIDKQKTWDKKWRMVMFDIPEKKKKIRDLIRFHLKRIGFLQIQGSVWIYPYPCEEIITIIKNNFNLNREIIYLTTDSFEKDEIYRKKFNL